MTVVCPFFAFHLTSYAYLCYTEKDGAFAVEYTGSFYLFMIKCILFDRDGTLGELVDKRYPDTLIPYTDVRHVFDALKTRGYIVGIISNQSSIARGTGGNYDFEGEFTAWHADIWEICPHDTQDNCNCRKPKSGMLLSVCKRLQLQPEECMIVGDRLSDVQCAKNVNAHAALVLTGFGEAEKTQTLSLYPDVPVFKQFDKVLTFLQ